MATATRFQVGDLVLWHDDQGSYEGRVAGQRRLNNGAVLVHLRPEGAPAYMSHNLVAVNEDRLSLLERSR